MNRLTRRTECGDAYYPECFDYCMGEGASEKCNDCEYDKKICDTLADYEDTGLTPEQVKELKERDTPKSLMERHYEEPGEKPYIKYTCPNGCKNQPLRKSNFCSLCGQRLKWEE